jgi:hypothetical protein
MTAVKEIRSWLNYLKHQQVAVLETCAVSWFLLRTAPTGHHNRFDNYSEKLDAKLHTLVVTMHHFLRWIDGSAAL